MPFGKHKHQQCQRHEHCEVNIDHYAPREHQKPRSRRQPDRPRAFRVPFVPWFPLISVLLCGGLMTGLTVITWLRFVVWLALGLAIYIFYSRHHSEFAKAKGH
jgi:amino acid transporter